MTTPQSGPSSLLRR